MVSGLAAEAGLRVVQVSPPSMEYCRFVMGLPPSAPRLNETWTAPVSSATAEIEGAAGTDRGVPVALGDAGPAPAAFTARTSTP